MIHSVTVITDTNESLTFELSNPEPSEFAITSIEGIGMGKSDILVSEFATLDGGAFSRGRVPTRNIVLNLVFMDFQHSIEELRHKCYLFFGIKRKISLLFETDERRCIIDGYVESNEPSIFSSMEGSQISIICPVPFFRKVIDNGTGDVYDGISSIRVASSGLFEFPFTNQLGTRSIQFGTRSGGRVSQEIYYSGDIETGVRLHIVALENTRPNFMHFRNHGISLSNSAQSGVSLNNIYLGILGPGKMQTNDEVIFSTIRGNMYATLTRGGTEYNILAAMVKYDAPEWLRLKPGLNILDIDTRAYNEVNALTAANVLISLEFPILYSGV